MSQDFSTADERGVGDADPMTLRDNTQGLAARANVTDSTHREFRGVLVPEPLGSRGTKGDTSGDVILRSLPAPNLARVGLADPVLQTDVLEGKGARADVIDGIRGESVPSPGLPCVVNETVLSAVGQDKMIRSDAQTNTTQMVQQSPLGNRAILQRPHVSVSLGSVLPVKAVSATSSPLPNPARGFPTTIFLKPVQGCPPLCEALIIYRHQGGVQHGV